MTVDVIAVNMAAVGGERVRSTYHHGNLRAGLVGTGLALARQRGPAAVVLREAARRLGVTPAAAYRHFRDRDDLLLAVRREALSLMGQRMLDTARAAGASHPLAGFRALGQAYVEFALDEPGLFRTLASPGVPVPLDYETPQPDPSHLLAGALDDLVTAGLLPLAAREHADAVAWAAVHGLAVLLLDGLLPRADAVTLLDRTLDAVAFGLLPAPQLAQYRGDVGPDRPLTHGGSSVPPHG